jgi:hypothetical protein
MRRLRVDADTGELGGDQAVMEEGEKGEYVGAARDTFHEGISTFNCGLSDCVEGGDGNDIFVWYSFSITCQSNLQEIYLSNNSGFDDTS